MSKYIRAKTLPGPVHLAAKALGMPEKDLLPSRGVDSVTSEASAFDMRDVGEGKVWLKINQAVPMSTALKIAALLNDA